MNLAGRERSRSCAMSPRVSSRDVLSDANRVNFHCFQILAWTIVLGFIFIGQVYQKLAMSESSNTLLGLMDSNAGTFLELKIPEDTGPKK
jgi:hypothetical protein